MFRNNALSCQLWVPNSTTSTASEGGTDEQVNAPRWSADTERMSQSWWCLCWTRGQTHHTASRGWQRKGRCNFVVTCADGWHWVGLLSSKGCSPTKETRIHHNPWVAVSGWCHNRGEENNWHLLSKFLPHLLVKNAPEVLGGVKARAKEVSLA